MTHFSTLQVLVYVFAAFGFAAIAGHSKITLPFREGMERLGRRFAPARWALDLIECPMCLGFWEGLFVGSALFGWTSRAVVMALATSASNLLLARLAGLVDP